MIKLSALNIDPAAVTVSGLSAGGFMAVQMHVAYSGTFNGSAIFAGGPYFCALGNLMIATEQCMYALGGPDADKSVTYTNTQAAAGTIDSTSNLADDKVFLFSGTKDTVVNPRVMAALEDYYGNYIRSDNIVTEFNFAAQHCLPTLNYGEACTVKMSPYIGKCNYDGAGIALNTMYGNALETAGKDISSNLFKFDQTAFYPKGVTSSSSSLDTTGYIYIPTACANNEQCKLHISYHGCSQGQDFIGDQFAADTGFNTWAEANNIVVVYPYAVKSLSLGNGNGCFDWWGYTNADYALKSGVQMEFSKNIIDTLMGI